MRQLSIIPLLLLFISLIISAEDDIEKFLLPIQSEVILTSSNNTRYFTKEEDHEELCGKEGRLVKQQGNRLLPCESNSECLPPSECHSSGFCCMIALNQEPPPVGCPMGTRSLRNSSGIELTCSPNIPDSCPGGAMCYTDSLTSIRRCCAEDPGQGCPSGSRVVLTLDDKPCLCTPGSSTGQCSIGTMCQWSHLIDRYQCCQPDNGCPRLQSPVLSSSGRALPCSPSGAICPNGASCLFNFWTASYQCCQLNTADLCAVGRVPFLKDSDSTPRSCKTSRECPNGFECSDNKICCGNPGTCPNAFNPMVDTYGRLTACSTRTKATCPHGSSCMDTSTISQKLCCTQTEYSCVDTTASPYPNRQNPQICSLADPYSCPGGNQCMPSNVNSVSICCKPRHVPRLDVINPCPAGWIPSPSKITYCLPNVARSSCPGFSSCLMSNNVRQQYVCCIPNETRMADAIERCINPNLRVERRNGRARQCTPGRSSTCGIGFSCQPSIRDGYLCCTAPRAQAQLQFQCPLNGQSPVTTQTGTNQFCTQPGAQGECPQNALCLAASNAANTFICCFSTSTVTPICPNNAFPQSSPTSLFVACSINIPNSCNAGFSCVIAANDPNTALCCSTSNQQNPTCPNGATLLFNNGLAQFCNPSQTSSCPSPYSCQAALNNPGTFVCCSLPPSSTCPASFTPSLDTNGNSIFCSPSQPAGCPSGAVCLQSPQTNSFLCCLSSSAPRVCPNNQNALLTSSGSLETCSGPGSPCSRSTYSCQLSTILAQYVCCGSDTSIGAQCADGRETYSQTPGITYSCNAMSTPSGCPIGFDCALSNQQGINVCCRTGGSPSTGLSCPSGWNPYRNDIDGQSRTCTGALDVSCPAGYSCTPSSFSSSSFICCRLATSLRCISGESLILNSQPRLCSKSRTNQCPIGYSCQQSTNPTVSICCTDGTSSTSSPIGDALLCPDRSSPSLINGNVRSCPVEGSNGGCPLQYTCQRSNKGILVCCINSSSARRPITRDELAHVCGTMAVPFRTSSGPLKCSRDSSICPLSHPCIPSFTSSSMYCCQDAECPSGVGIGSAISSCKSSSDCGPNALCQMARNIAGLSICCSAPVSTGTRCSGRETQLRDGRPIECIKGNRCDSGYECSDETNSGRSICCGKRTNIPVIMQTEVCPENRLVARNTLNEVIYCDDTAFTCAHGLSCHPQRNGPRFICCSSIPKCPNGAAQRDRNGMITTCSSSSSCRAGFACLPSTVQSVSICCSQVTSAMDIFLSPPKSEVQTSSDGSEWVVLEG